MCVLPVWEEARSATVSGSRSEPRWEAVEELAGVQTHQAGKVVPETPAAIQEPKWKTEEPQPSTNLDYFTLLILLQCWEEEC